MRENSPVSVRAILVGLALGALLCGITGYNDYLISGPWLGSGHFPLGVNFLVLSVTFAFNLLVKKLRPGAELKPDELLVIWCLTLVASGLPAAGLARYLFASLMGLGHFATPENEWKEIIFPNVPDWLIVRDQKAIEHFYRGVETSNVPWHAWITPLSFWLTFFFVSWLSLICLSLILRKQWVERERLVFPLVQLPVEMAQAADNHQLLNPFLRNRSMWVGFSIAAIFHAANGSHYYLPKIPGIPAVINLDNYFNTKPWSEMQPVWLRVLPSVIGIGYLVSLEVNGSICLFFLLHKAGCVLSEALGYSTIYRRGLMYSDMGGWIVFVAFLIWSASAHFKVMLRSFRSGHISGEQWAFVGFVLSLLALSFMLKLIGVGLIVALGVVILQIVMAVALARMVAESGLMYVQPSFAANDLIYAAVGTSRLSSGTLTGITFMFAVGFRDLREDLLPRILNSFKIAGSGKGSLRYLVIAIIIALILGTAVTTFSHLRLMYSAGASGLEFWTFNIAPATPFQWLNSLLLNPTGTSWPAMGFVSIGSVAMLSLLLMRRAFLWWHVHPIGFIICRIWFIENIWFSIFIAWLAKSSILRLGGLKGYNKARPFFLGLVLGEIFVGGILVFVSCIVGHGYNFLGF